MCWNNRPTSRREWFFGLRSAPLLSGVTPKRQSDALGPGDIAGEAIPVQGGAGGILPDPNTWVFQYKAVLPHVWWV